MRALSATLDAQQMRHAFDSGGTQSAGLWEFLRTAADSKQLHTAHASAAGLMSAYIAKDGFTGADRIFDGPQGMAAGMSTDADPPERRPGYTLDHGRGLVQVPRLLSPHAPCSRRADPGDARAPPQARRAGARAKQL
ncbi:MAG: hypothetical protein A3E79_17070 [Burkholderiales bacterium RIFCSPHIGHO2_12_FULL_61_11]|nr:MAG: hypothetical protein A3E79_17070 [Burkholderiales bacterium RIFCSPHIGHO2_12_FULL_61_11]